MEHGLGCVEIAKRIYRSDGKTKFGETAIVNCMNKLRKNKNWRGGERRVQGRCARRPQSKTGRSYAGC